jgi:hypothetical protein
MSYSSGFIVQIPNEETFYEIKTFLEALPNSRLIYCTRTTGKKLYIKTEEGFTNE